MLTKADLCEKKEVVNMPDIKFEIVEEIAVLSESNSDGRESLT